jgi:diguanylate cyclase (GGDEF)-like protein
VQRDEHLVEEARARVTKPLAGRDRWTSVGLGGSFVATAVATAVYLPGHRPLSVLTAVLLVGAYAVVSRIEFELGPGSAVPTQLVLVPMLFLLPVSAVPLFVAAGFVAGLVVDQLQGKRHGQRVFVVLSCSWHAVGPAVVLSLFGHDDPRWSDAPIYVAALAAQFVLDFVSSAARERLAFGASPRRLLPFMGWIFAVDALLAPVALGIAFVGVEAVFASLLVLPLAGLLTLLARDRAKRIDRALELTAAYRGAMRDARSDPLTGLGNRLAWDEALEATAAGPSVGPVSVILIDLDGLKVANDTRGHDFGDRLLRSLGEALRSSVRPGDLVARIGGDELGVLMPKTDDSGCAAVAGRIRERIADTVVDGFRLSAALGHATRPLAADVADAARGADMQLYLVKRARPPRLFDVTNVVPLARPDEREAGTRESSASRRQSADAFEVLVAALRERDEFLADHVSGVADLALAVGKRLGLSESQLTSLSRAASLHDVGKLAVPDAIINKCAALSADEWNVMRGHPVVGARILARAMGLLDVASLVRASHERYDGFGYPDGLSAEQIPLGARIVFVCDAYDAMTSDRPYRPGMTHDEALAELRANAGAQFDPLVVDAFCEVVVEEKRSRLAS